MKMPTTTLEKIRAHGPCESGWRMLTKALGGVRTYGLRTPVTLLKILDSNGVDDALWALRACDGAEQFSRELACDFAERVLPIYEAAYPGDRRIRDCIETARRFARGQASDEELAAAGDAAGAAVRAAAWDAAGAAERTEQEHILRAALARAED